MVDYQLHSLTLSWLNLGGYDVIYLTVCYRLLVTMFSQQILTLSQEGTNTGLDYWTDTLLVLCIFLVIHLL